MSGLRALLEGRVPPGVYRWDGVVDDEARRAVAPSPWWLARVEERPASRREALVALGRALDFPGHYGANLDALWDCLRDLPAPTVLLWPGWADLAVDDPDGLEAVLAVLGERAEEAADLAVLLQGAGPAIDVPLLD